MYRQGTGYTALYTCVNNWFQSVLTGTDYTALYTCFNNWLQSVPAGTCYTALYTCFNNWLQSVLAGTCYTALYTCFNTGYRVYRLVLATQPCTLASTTVKCTGWYLLHSLVHLLQQLVTECTGWYWLHSLVHLLQPTGYKSTNRVLATQSLLYRASPQLVT